MMQEICPACQAKVLFVTEPVYEGFSKVGDLRRCTACGYQEPHGALAAKAEGSDAFSALFSKDELPEKPKVFLGDENACFCRYCSHYVVNPFRQRCMLHERDVDATDTCEQFAQPDP